jgi:hypothetical protein
MAQQNENIHLFIIKDAYQRTSPKPVFNTNASALEDIFGKLNF